MTSFYSRPKNREEAEQVLQSNLGNLFFPEDIGALKKSGNEVTVDLQNLELGYIKQEHGDLLIGGTALLESIYSYCAIDPIISKSIAVEFGLNKRNRHTIGTVLRQCSGKSLFMSLLVALDVKIQVLQSDATMTIGEWIDDQARRFLVVKQVTIPAHDFVNIEWIANTPMSLPEISLAAANWKGGRTRFVLGGIPPHPELLIDGQVTDKVSGHINIACSQYINQYNYYSFYKDIIQTFSSRLLAQISKSEE